MSLAALPCRCQGQPILAGARLRLAAPRIAAGPGQRVGGGQPAGAGSGSGSARPRPMQAHAVARPFGPVPPDQDVCAPEEPSSGWEVVRGYYKLFRGWNALPSLVLVLLGAWTGAGKTVLALKHLTVWFMGFASGAVALASCAINDYFDWRIDAINDASKPIPSGLIPPDRALLVSCLVYICLLAVACAVPNTGVRLIIAASAAATVLYTPVFKKQTLVKNCVVACTIAAAPLAGALAAGVAGPGLRAVLPPSLFLWLGIMQREILMDIQDRRGDGAAGVQTLPVVLGPRAALATCMGLLVGCAVVAVHAALCGSGLAWAWAAHPVLEPMLRVAALAAVGWNLSRPAAATLQVLRSGFDREHNSRAINVAMSSVGVGTLLLAILC